MDEIYESLGEDLGKVLKAVFRSQPNEIENWFYSSNSLLFGYSPAEYCHYGLQDELNQVLINRIVAQAQGNLG